MAFLTLEDGQVFEGIGFGAIGDVPGEVVFNTSMTGYQEILTDPSYCGQIVTMTYPIVGNYGVNEKDFESDSPKVNGFIVREYCEFPNNWMCEKSLDEFLKHHGITALSGIDTRALTRSIRDKGAMRGIITQNIATDEQIAQMKAYVKSHPVDEMTCKETYTMGEGGKYNVAVLDFGLKRNILYSLIDRGCNLTIYPARTSPEVILNGNYDGVMLTNGPGDPKENEEVIENIKQIFGKLPMFGICLGHQLIALAAGADSQKLKFGHRGANHPVKDLAKDHTFITSQNHGYAIKNDGIPAGAIITHISMNDKTVEGIEYEDGITFSVRPRVDLRTVLIFLMTLSREWRLNNATKSQYKKSFGCG